MMYELTMFFELIYYLLLIVAQFVGEHIIIVEGLLLVLLGLFIYFYKNNKINEKEYSKKILAIIWGLLQILALLLIALFLCHQGIANSHGRRVECSSAYGCICEGKKTCDCKYTNEDGEEEDIICPNNNIDYTAE